MSAHMSAYLSAHLSVHTYVHVSACVCTHACTDDHAHVHTRGLNTCLQGGGDSVQRGGGGLGSDAELEQWRVLHADIAAHKGLARLDCEPQNSVVGSSGPVAYCTCYGPGLHTQPQPSQSAPPPQLLHFGYRHNHLSCYSLAIGTSTSVVTF